MGTPLKDLAALLGLLAVFAVAVLICVGLFKVATSPSNQPGGTTTTERDYDDYPVTRKVCSDMYDVLVSQGRRPSLPRDTMIDDCVKDMTP